MGLKVPTNNVLFPSERKKRVFGYECSLREIKCECGSAVGINPGGLVFLKKHLLKILSRVSAMDILNEARKPKAKGRVNCANTEVKLMCFSKQPHCVRHLSPQLFKFVEMRLVKWLC
jgi:hypothetical protein